MAGTVRPFLAAVAAAVLATVVVGCEGRIDGSPAATTLPLVATAEPSADGAELDAARFRRDFGLRSDIAWIRAVANDPHADHLTFGVPLTADEVADLNGRFTTIDELKQAVLPNVIDEPDYGGAWIDQDRGGILVVQFVGPTILHTADILSRVRPGAPIEVRQVRWTLADLETFKDRISAEEAWFDALPSYLYAVGIDVSANRVTVELSSADPEVDAKIRAHFGLGDDVVAVTSDGTGTLLLAPGRLSVRAVDADGRPVSGLACVMISDVKNATEPRPLPMPTTDEEGLCERDVAPSGYTIQLETGHAPPTVIATARATVRPRKLTELTIQVP